MNFDLRINENELTVFCSKNFKNFSKEFINYYKTDISRIKEILNIKEKVSIIVALTDNESDANFIYGKSDFSVFFTDTGAYAYINLNGKKSKKYMFRSLMHELVHYLYKYYIFGSEKERITWVDEGLATFISNQKQELEDNDQYLDFLKENFFEKKLVDLNMLNHKNKSFGNNNGYNFSYIAIRYLFETNSNQQILNILRDENKLNEIGKTVLNDAKKHYKINN